MPRTPRRGRVNKRYAENVVKQTISRRGNKRLQQQQQHERPDESVPRVPHFEEDPHWRGSGSRDSYSQSMSRSHYDDGYDRSWSDPPNHRGAWGKRSRPSGGRGRGQGIRKSQAPLALTGIPHLQRSFVMDRHEVTGGDSTVVNESPQGIENFNKNEAPPSSKNSDVFRTERLLNQISQQGFKNSGQDLDVYNNDRNSRNRNEEQSGEFRSESFQSLDEQNMTNVNDSNMSFRSVAGYSGCSNNSARDSGQTSCYPISAATNDQPLTFNTEKANTSSQCPSQKDLDPRNYPCESEYSNRQRNQYDRENTSGGCIPHVEEFSYNRESSVASSGGNLSSGTFTATTSCVTTTNLVTLSETTCYNQVSNSTTSSSVVTSSSRTSDTSCSSVVPEAALPDPQQLELETERYYSELSDKKKKSSKEDPKVISASQVAKITVNYKMADEQKEIEKQQEKEAEEIEKTRKESIQTAWSVLHQYWEFVRENPYDFNGWTYLLNHVETMGDLETARSAFDGFLPLYPYCFAYWKKLSDMEATENEIRRSLGVMLIGTECIPYSVDLWMPLLTSFVSYAHLTNLPFSCIRGMYERSLETVGMSWTSSTLWETCITYEENSGDLIRVMSLFKRLLATPTKLYNKHWESFLTLVRDHHPRNLLAVEEYETLRKETCKQLKIKYTPGSLVSPKSIHKTPQPEDKLTSHIKEKIVASYITTHEENEKEVDKRWKFEERIKRPYFHVKSLDRKQIKNWKEYLKFETGVGDPLRIIPLFERCLVACALYDDFWCKYASYMESHVQDIVDGKYKDHPYGLDSSGDESGVSKTPCESAIEKKVGEGMASVQSNEVQKIDESEKSKSSKVNVSEGMAGVQSSEVQKNSESIKSEGTTVNIAETDASSIVVKQVNDKKDDVEDDKSSGDVMVRGSDSKVEKDITQDSSDTHGKVTKVIGKDISDSVNNSESIEKKVTYKEDIDGQNLQNDEKDSVDNDGQTTDVIAEPPTFEQLRSELCHSISLDERALKCPPLTPKWIMSGVSWEDVRQIYRRGSWIHCPSKPNLLMQWAEFEETQGNLETARELINTVVGKHPTLLEARMKQIEFERRAGCYEKVEDLYAESSRLLKDTRCRSWLAIRYARFLFKILMEPDRALVVLRKALKKDRGNKNLYHHVFDICYQRQPLDCQGVMASVLLALSSKELSNKDKYWFAFKRVEFLKEHGDIVELKKSLREMNTFKDAADADAAIAESEEKKKSAEAAVKEGEAKNGNTVAAADGKDTKDGGASTSNAAEAAAIPAVVQSAGDAVAAVTDVAQPTLQFPVPYFGADGAITYTPMEGYGYGHSDPNQALPTAQEVVQGVTGSAEEKKNEDYSSVPPVWEHDMQIGSYGYGKCEDRRWHQDPSYEYNDLLTKGYPDRLKDKKEEPFKLPFPISIDHLRKRPGDTSDMAPLPDTSQPPPTASGVLPPPSLTSDVDRLHPTRLMMNRPPSLLGVCPPGMAPLRGSGQNAYMDNGPPGVDHFGLNRDHSSMLSSLPPFTKRRYPEDYSSSSSEPPYKMLRDDSFYARQNRSEYDCNYTLPSGHGAEPSHRANFGSYNDETQFYSYGNSDISHRPPLSSGLRTSPELGRLSDSSRYSLHDENNYDTPVTTELVLQYSENLSINVPEWLVKEGGELKLSETVAGVSLIQYWPNFMTGDGQKSLFRVLRKRIKWYQRRALVDGKWINLPHLLSWIGPCDYTYSGVVLEKNPQWLPEIVDLLHRLIQYTKTEYNCCSLTLYRNGYDSRGRMEEHHQALQKNPSIATVSLGTTRIFEMRRKNGQGFLRFPLFPGSLMFMEGATQEDWDHQFPKQPSMADERINITFRKMYMIKGLTI